MTRRGTSLGCASLVCGALLLAAPPSRAETPPATAGAATEPAGPAPSAAVKTLLSQADAKGLKDAERLEIADRARALAHDSADVAGEAMAQSVRGKALKSIQRTAESRDAFLAAANLWQGVGAIPERIRALYELALLESNFAAAHTLTRDAVGAARAETLRPLAAANALHDGGNAFLHAQRPEEARPLVEAAVEIREKLIPGSVLLGRSWNNLALVERRTGELARALEHYDRARGIFELEGEPKYLAGVYTNLGALRLLAKDLDAAEAELGRARVIYEAMGPDEETAAEMWHNLGSLSRSRKDLASARTYAERELAIRLASEKKAGVPMARVLVANIALDANDLASAEQQLDALSVPGDRTPREESLLQLLAANVSYLRKEYDAAYTSATSALAAQECVAIDTLESVPILTRLGLIEQRRGNLDEALVHLQRAWSITRRQGAFSDVDDAARAFEQSHASVAARLVDVYVDLKRPDEAFRVAEEGRAQALLDQLAAHGLDRPADEVLLETFRAKNAEFRRAGQRLGDSAGQEWKLLAAVRSAEESKAPQSFVQTRRDALGEFRKHQAPVREAYVRARVEMEQALAKVRAGASRGVPEVGDVASARGALPPDALFVSFSFASQARGRTHVFLVTSNPTVPLRHFLLEETPESLQKGADEMRKFVGAGPTKRGLFGNGTQFVDSSRLLFQRLFPSAARPLLLSAKRIIISPDGPLWDVPFAALITNENGPPAWLGVQKPLSYAVSLRVLAGELNRKHDPAAEGGVRYLLVGDPVVERVKTASKRTNVLTEGSAPETRRARLSFMPDGYKLEPLPYSRDESSEIANLYDANALLDDAATERAVRAQIESAAIVHLATHGFYHPSLGMSSGILLSLPVEDSPETRSDDDGCLEAWEIANQLHLRASLVVLSACETGLGQRVPGEGVIGLTRAFQIAGARSIVATLWSIADATTKQLMVRFHTSLRQGVARDEALRRMMQSATGSLDNRDPFFWAAFVLVGDPGPLPASVLSPSRKTQ